MFFRKNTFWLVFVIVIMCTAVVSCRISDDKDQSGDSLDTDDDTITDDDNEQDDVSDDDSGGDDDNITDDDDNVIDDDDCDDDDNDDDNNNDTTPPVTPGFAFIPSGTFIMGSRKSEPGRDIYEDQHQVTLTHDFEMGMYETTQGKFKSLIHWNPSSCGPYFSGPDCGDERPVDEVSWFDALAYANQLSLEMGYSPCYVMTNVTCEYGSEVGDNYLGCLNHNHGGIDWADLALNGVASVYDCEGFRLPTEAEWEYAARAGTTTAFYSGAIKRLECEPLDRNLNTIGWYCGNSPNIYQAVGRKKPNAWGLYDMSGNVFEWVWDRKNDYPAGPVTDPDNEESSWWRRVVRGGGFVGNAWHCRSAARGDDWPGCRSYIGFRLARTLR